MYEKSLIRISPNLTMLRIYVALLIIKLLITKGLPDTVDSIQPFSADLNTDHYIFLKIFISPGFSDIILLAYLLTH